MPVSHGHHRLRSNKMTKSYQYFDVGEKFFYSPLSNPDDEMELVPVKTQDPVCSGCCLIQYCAQYYNCQYHTDISDFSEKVFHPLCNGIFRKDGNNVVFARVS